MSVIGVYDSGIGGLTTLSALRRALPHLDFCYFADNINSPFGTKPKEEIFRTVRGGVDRLRQISDMQVIACNTASTVVRPEGAFLLTPVLDTPPENTLVLSTPATEKALELKEKGYVTADTKDLATMVEIMGSLSFKSRAEIRLDFIDEYVKNMLETATEKSDEIKWVSLGCSHYVYVKRLVKKYLKNAEIIDGNTRLIYEILPHAKHLSGEGKTTFHFSGMDESDKYAWILGQLDKNARFYGI